MSFGLCNASFTFQATMNTTLAPFICRFMAIFFDDILVYNRSLSFHLKHLTSVFSFLQENVFYLRGSKFIIGQCHLEYLGHIISQFEVALEPSKIKAMVDWPIPSSIRALCGFLRLT